MKILKNKPRRSGRAITYEMFKIASKKCEETSQIISIKQTKKGDWNLSWWK